MKALRSTMLVGVMVLVSCASTTDQVIEPPQTSLTSQAPLASLATSTSQAEPTSRPDTSATSDLESTTVTESSNEPALRCVTIADFEDAAANDLWQVVNDNVMGGRSLGDRAFADETMLFTGEINTDGGGFSSLRVPLAQGVLNDADRIVFRVRADARSYKVTFADNLDGRGRVSFNVPISFESPGEWETATVLLADLVPVINGRLVESEPFRPDLATRLGVILSDGADGEFTLEIDSISACSLTET